MEVKWMFSCFFWRFFDKILALWRLPWRVSSFVLFEFEFELVANLALSFSTSLSLFFELPTTATAAEEPEPDVEGSLPLWTGGEVTSAFLRLPPREEDELDEEEEDDDAALLLLLSLLRDLVLECLGDGGCRGWLWLWAVGGVGVGVTRGSSSRSSFRISQFLRFLSSSIFKKN